MKLLTKALEKTIPALYATEHDDEKMARVKFFNPMGAGTWLVVEGDKLENGDWRFFGLVDLFEKEWGYFMLSELEEVTLPLGMKIERDIHWTPRVVA
tara:strand:+ start:1284 stop:1574 length:291 start_codon:yes stop_codon:yes gene_type:complete